MSLEIEHLLPRVEKPARYVGSEYNSIVKDWDKVKVKVAFAFPDVYEVGMSHLGLQILYHVVNQRDDALMERVFAPWPDMERELTTSGLPLFSLESRRPISDFDVVAFTLQYELSYTNILNMLYLGGIPLYARDRGDGDPLVIAGGPCAYNPEPLAPFIDAVFLGEGEEAIHEIVEVVSKRRAGMGRRSLLRELSHIDGIYIPSFYDVQYDALGYIKSIVPVEEGIPEKVTKRIISDLDHAPFPARPIVPYLGVVHDRAMLEVFRGCTRGCRFCQAGAVYRPVREKHLETLLQQAEDILKNTGYNELSLASLSTTDYSGVRKLITKLVKRYSDQNVSISLPSLRVDAFAVDLAQAVQKVRKSTLTFAPEAGTQRLRNVINKQVTEEDLLQTAYVAFSAGWLRIKLYFMIGLPTETFEDLEGIADLARKVLQKGKEAGVPKGRLSVTISTSSFVPKAHTPFQWEPQDPIEVLREKQAQLKRLIKGKGLVFNYHDPEASFLEAVFARGDRRLAPVLYRAWELGCRLDGWRECFRYDLWERAFRDTGVNPAFYAQRRFTLDDVLPWDHLDAGLSKKFLWLERKRALAGQITEDCRYGKCTGCGLCPALEIEPYLQEARGDATH
ncbi:MAG: TIGR03960 family B12-binding radical SAM protein [Peptococcaceae bacterium]|nr:TIGR03960 family B12-binding radical SAM protein [Peptococcaceae bacterium]